jgi:putative phosphoribosyl transferase
MWSMTMLDRAFADRREAGRMLAAALAHLRDRKPLVLALPRGGVPVAYEIAVVLGAELDLLLVRKIGAPGHPEYGIGALVDGANPQIVLNREAVRMTGASKEYIEATARAELAELERRRQAYRGGTPAPVLEDRTVIIVDDGIATGGTVKAALQGARQSKPTHLVLAVPVAPAESLRELQSECDEIVCLLSPSPFYAVGAHYRDFSQTSDEEVVRLLAAARQTA